MPRLPSALGLSGAMRCGGLVQWSGHWTPIEPSTPLSLSPLTTHYRPPPLCPLHAWQQKRRRNKKREHNPQRTAKQQNKGCTLRQKTGNINRLQTKARRT
eukprot:scaffold652_cov100-Isochrysis_galbana.AAC.6